ncbi:MAG: hypothetical protein F9K40_02520 [Kofleriaceae bacterium]|nr:MAG: hypothetical protein F9K40_02520 [Kofleriaceae bacterium]
MKRVLVVSHADADGHVIAEQVRRNLAMVSTFDVTTVVDPKRTKDHRTWTKLDAIPEIESAEIVFFVDLMFAPSSFAVEAEALVEFVRARPMKTFFVLDHHPLPLRRLYRAPNLRPVYRPDVLDCTFGTASHMMVLAALLETQPTRAIAMKEPTDEFVAKGIKRAAAPGGPLAGEKLLALLRYDRWSELEALGRDDPRFHRLPRGLRPAGDPISDLMSQLVALAGDLLESAKKPPPGPGEGHPARNPMSYDFETASNRAPPTPPITPSNRRDLEAIVTLLELAAICLTHAPDADFTTEQLLAEARRLGGEEIHLEENDVRIVLGKAGFLRKVGGRLRLK